MITFKSICALSIVYSNDKMIGGGIGEIYDGADIMYCAKASTINTETLMINFTYDDSVFGSSYE